MRRGLGRKRRRPEWPPASTPGDNTTRVTGECRDTGQRGHTQSQGAGESYAVV